MVKNVIFGILSWIVEVGESDHPRIHTAVPVRTRCTFPHLRTL